MRFLATRLHATVMLARIPFLSSIKKAFGFSGEQTSKSMLSDSGLKINHVEEIALLNHQKGEEQEIEKQNQKNSV